MEKKITPSTNTLTECNGAAPGCIKKCNTSQEREKTEIYLFFIFRSRGFPGTNERGVRVPYLKWGEPLSSETCFGDIIFFGTNCFARKKQTKSSIND